MKYLILTLITIVFMTLVSFVQDEPSYDFFPRNFRYEIHGKYKRAIKKENLNGVKLISDVISGYPSNWVTEYDSVEIMATCNGVAKKVVSKNNILNNEQKKLLSTVDMGTDIAIKVIYSYKEPATNFIEKNTMNVLLTVIPDVEAEYGSGYLQMIKYLEENSINKVSESDPKQFQKIIIGFTVGEKGEISNAKITHASEDLKINKLLLDVITKMPRWKPAQNSKGINVKQEFEFSLNDGKDGC